MGKSIKRQGASTNKLIITWKDYSDKPYGTELESFRCTSIERVNKILSKRNRRRMYCATFYDNKRAKTVININTKDTILDI